VIKQQHPDSTLHYIDDLPGAHKEVQKDHPDVKLLSAIWGYGKGHIGKEMKDAKQLLEYAKKLAEDQGKK
jgi:hypothetical protein